MPTTAIGNWVPTVMKSQTTSKGFNDINGQDFIKVMITQLQRQDPLDPAKSDQLLSQLSQIKQLESSTQLNTTLQGVGLQQSIGAAGNLIGKTVAGLADNGDQITGTVTSVKVQDKKAYLELDTGKELALESVVQIAPNNTAAAGTLSQLTQLLGGTQGNSISQLLATPQGQATLSQLLSTPQAQAYLQGLTNNSSTSSNPLTQMLSALTGAK